MLKLDPAVKEKWVAALRSGEYGQTTKTLRSIETNSYCCLGVLCDLHSWEKGFFWESSSYMGETCYPSNEVIKWAYGREVKEELQCSFTVPVPTSIQPEGSAPGLTTNLTMLNDEYGLNFNQIADIIEKEL